MSKDNHCSHEVLKAVGLKSGLTCLGHSELSGKVAGHTQMLTTGHGLQGAWKRGLQASSWPMAIMACCMSAGGTWSG